MEFAAFLMIFAISLALLLLLHVLLMLWGAGILTSTYTGWPPRYLLKDRLKERRPAMAAMCLALLSVEIVGFLLGNYLSINGDAPPLLQVAGAFGPVAVIILALVIRDTSPRQPVLWCLMMGFGASILAGKAYDSLVYLDFLPL